jgi:phosphatidylglycerophosphatase A
MKRESNFIALLVAEFFYCGRSPIMPGTVGSLGSLLLWIPSVYWHWPWFIKIFLLIFIFGIGIWASKIAINFYQKIDPKQVVIDEVVGQGIPFLIISPNIFEIILAFLLFRFFDILKPWPISWVEKRFKNAWGVMLDDVVAGIFALIILAVIKSLI